MASLTEIRLTRRQHLVIVRAVGVVTVETIFTDGGMIKEERSTLVRVAAIAGLRHGRGLQIFRSGAAVRVVARRTRHLAFFNGHMRVSLHLGDDVLMALRAD